MVTLVTGATGFVGGHVIERLCRDTALGTVRALVRDPRRGGALPDSATVVIGDLTDAESLARAVDGAGTVIHCAAVLEHDDPAAFERVNVGGTTALLRACEGAGVGRFVHMSSIGVYGLLRSTPATEEHPTAPTRPYGGSKLAAERAVIDWAGHTGRNAVILRPTAIFGARDRTLTPRLLRLARLPLAPLPGGGRSLMSIVDARDVAEAAMLAARRAPAGCRIYNVQGPVAPAREMLSIVRRRIGGRGRGLRVPVAPALAAAAVFDLAQLVARPHRTRVAARIGLLQLSRDMIFDTRRIAEELGFRARHRLEDTLETAVAWRLAQEATCASS